MGSRWLGAGLFVSGVLSVWVATRCRIAEVRSVSQWATLRDSLAMLNTTGPGPHRVYINERPITVAMSTSDGSLGDVLDSVARDCENSDAARAMGLPPAVDDSRVPRRRVRLKGVRRQRVGDAAATVCIFGEDDGSEGRGGDGQDGAPAPPMRYVLARERAGRVEVLSVTTETETSLDELLPETGDAPGSDPPNGARPSHARRILTARLADSPTAVRLYEVDESVATAVTEYDRDSLAAGWVPAPAVSATVHDARLLSRGPDEIVVSFGALPTSTAIAVLSSPFGGAAPWDVRRKGL